MNTVNVLGITFHALTMDGTLDILEGYLQETKNHIVVTPNPEGVMQARRNQSFESSVREADLCLADGTGIVLAAKFTGQKIPGRVRGLDTILALCERLTEKDKNFTVYFFGGRPGVAERAKAKMEARHPNMKVIGYHHGYFDDDTEIIDEINSLSPDILLVCIGMPRAELWAASNRNINTRITMCLGGTLDIMSGDLTPTPPIIRKIGLEWLHRLIREPRRAKRQLDIPRFVMAVISAKFRRQK
ncbi:MAG: WecB/TagA/CpsF family glycosyltransferase [Firmicutes bacterium]|nr:WecB/TagA/CpsF family glycosyltransferase [Bacillota bacterium]